VNKVRSSRFLDHRFTAISYVPRGIKMVLPPAPSNNNNNNSNNNNESQWRRPILSPNDNNDDDDARSQASTASTASMNTATNGESKIQNTEDEILRILRNRRNYYKVLNLTPQTCTNATVKKSYHRIARAIHPDKCKHPDSANAMAVVTAANSTLTTPTLKQSYDLYYNTQDVSENAQSGSNFDEWHSKSGAAVAGLPAWLVKALSTPIIGALVMLLMILFGLTFGVIVFVLCLAYLAVHMVFWFFCCCGCGGHCWPRYGEGARVHEIRQRRFFAMLRDYEEAQMFAAQRGEPDPEPSIFFATWNVIHPEDLNFEDGYDKNFKASASTAGGSYGSTTQYV
jgi:hypothetical protein